MIEPITNIDQLLSGGDEPDFIGATTVEKLLGRTDELGLATTPLTIARFGCRYVVDIEREPFDSREFIRFLNETSPSGRGQSAQAIEGDWVYALPGKRDTNIAKGHRKIPAWSQIEERAEPYVDVARNASLPFTRTYDSLPEFDNWVANLPEPQDLNAYGAKLQKETRKQVDNIISRADAGTCMLTDEVLQGLAKNPTKLLLKQLEHAGFIDASEFLGDLVKLRYSNKRGLTTREAIGQFSKLSYQERIVLQQAMIEGIISSGQGGSEYVEQLYVALADKMLKEKGLIPCIGSSGQKGYVDANSISERGIPVDYRELDNPIKGEHTDDYGNYVQETIEVRTAYLGNSYGRGVGRGVHYKTEIFRGKFTMLREVTMIPLISWSAGDTGRTFDLSWRDEHDTAGEIPTRTISDGLFGLIVVNYLSGDTEMPKALSISGFEGGRKQAMGAAQLPLLTLMFKKKIENGRLIQAIEQFAA